MQKSMKYVSLAAAGLLASGVAMTPEAGAVADFYQGKRVTIIIGYSAGGGYDTYARLVGRHLGAQIPGNPAVVMQNMPGAGSLTSVNFLYNQAPKDGTTLASFGRGAPTEPLFGNEAARFDPIRLNWIGSANNEVSVCVTWHTSPVKTFADAQQQESIIGGTGPGADTDTFPNVLNSVLGTQFRLITGFPGGNDINLAMERGEVDGRCGWSWSSVVATRQNWLDEKKINILVQMSTGKHPDLPDVPLVMDLAQDEDQRQVLNLIFARQTMGRPFAAPPDVPADRVRALRAAFDATMKDARFLEEARTGRIEIEPVSGAEIQELVESIYRASPAIVELAKNAIN